MWTETESGVIAVVQEVTYPSFTKKILFPDLQTSPTALDVSKLKLQYCPGQEKGIVSGDRVIAYLQDNHLLGSCLGLVEILAIKSQGRGFYERYFAGKQLKGWKTVIQSSTRNHLPFLFETREGVELGWFYVGGGVRADSPIYTILP